MTPAVDCLASWGHAVQGWRLRPVVHRGVPTAALVYDRLPVVDVFRQVTPDLLLGLMDARGLPAPFAFLLERARGGS